LLQAYKAVLGCDLPDEAKEQYVLPSLELLRKEINLFEFHDQKILTDMIADVKSHLLKITDNPENDTAPPPDSKPPPPPKTEESPTTFFGFFERDKDKPKETDKPPSSSVPVVPVSTKEDSSLTPSPSATPSLQPPGNQEESRFLNITSRFASFWGEKKN